LFKNRQIECQSLSTGCWSCDYYVFAFSDFFNGERLMLVKPYAILVKIILNLIFKAIDMTVFSFLFGNGLHIFNMMAKADIILEKINFRLLFIIFCSNGNNNHS